MRFVWYRRILIMLVLSASILATYLYIREFGQENEQVSRRSLDDTKVLVGGVPIGIYMKIDGVLVLDTEEIQDQNGNLCEPAKNLVKSGDYIIAINGEEVGTKNDLVQAVSELEDERVILKIRRDEEQIEVKFEPVEVENEDYKLGIWVRDSVQGLGTVTYVVEDGSFGALGHGIHDADTDELIEIERGNVYGINLIGIQKGESGTPGGLKGIIMYHSKNLLGTIASNTECGIYGKLSDIERVLENQETMELCDKKDIDLGEAVIRCAVDGTVQDYQIEILSVDYFTRNENKEIVIRVTDEELIEKTGGIVQGMSGSPIIQDGKLVGAVTHVLVNDPTRGYGIFIENMLEAAE